MSTKLSKAQRDVLEKMAMESQKLMYSRHGYQWWLGDSEVSDRCAIALIDQSLIEFQGNFGTKRVYVLTPAGRAAVAGTKGGAK